MRPFEYHGINVLIDFLEYCDFTEVTFINSGYNGIRYVTLEFIYLILILGI